MVVNVNEMLVWITFLIFAESFDGVVFMGGAHSADK